MSDKIQLVFNKSTKRFDRYEVVDPKEKIVGTVYIPKGEAPETLELEVAK